MPDPEPQPARCEESTTLEPLKRFELDRLIRFGYAGFLMIGILLFVVPNRVAPILGAGGTVVTPLVILAAGAAVYTLYRYVFNEMLFVRSLHWFHAYLDRRRQTPTNLANYLVKVYHVPAELSIGHDAYVEVRRGYFQEAQRLAFDRNHTEATIVYLTGVECIIAGCVLLAVRPIETPNWKAWLLLGLGVFTFVAAVRLDPRLFRQECRVLAANATKLPGFLQDRGLIKTANTAAQTH